MKKKEAVKSSPMKNAFVDKYKKISAGKQKETKGGTLVVGVWD
jgi:hypothetical protein